MNREKTRQHSCANEGCSRPASSDGLLCETCAIERALYQRERRDEREEILAGLPAEFPAVSSGVR